MRAETYKNILIVCGVLFALFYLAYFLPAAANNNMAFEALLLGIICAGLAVAICAYYWHVPREKVKDSNAGINHSLDTLPFGYVLFDENKQVVFSNPAVISALNLKAKISFGALVVAFGKTVDFEEKFSQAMRTQNPTQIDGVRTTSKEFSLIFSPIKAGHFVGCAVVIYDVTENNKQDRLRDEFFAMASHELRSPLASIRGNMSLILEYFAKDIKNPEVIGILSQSHSSAVRLIQIVNDFLDVSRLEHGKNIFFITKADLGRLANEVISELSYLATSKGLKIYFPDPGNVPMAAGDPNRLKQVIYNLLANAIHYTGSGSIKISVRQEKDYLRFEIEDTGMGIAKDRQPHLFEKFQPISSDALKSGGQSTGIGLYISKLLMDAQGGSIGLDRSEPGKGSAFYFTIPIAKP